MGPGTSGRAPWIGAALLVGVVYFLVGRLFALPASHVPVWRLAAWIVSACAYAGHIGYEHFKLRSSPRSTALHVAVAVAIGAFGLAVAAVIHTMSRGGAMPPTRLLAFVVWPVLAGVPAFLVAVVAAALVARLSPRVGPRA